MRKGPKREKENKYLIICGCEGCTQLFESNQDRIIHITRFHLPIED